MRPGRAGQRGLSNRAIMLFLFGLAVGVFCILWSLVSTLESAAESVGSNRQSRSAKPAAPERPVRLVDAAPAGEAFGGACALVNRRGALEVWWFDSDGEQAGGVPAVGAEGRIAGCNHRLVVASEKGLTEISVEGKRDVIGLPEGYAAPGPETPVGCSAADASAVHLTVGENAWRLRDGVAEPCPADGETSPAAARPPIDEDPDRQWALLLLDGRRQATVVLEGEALRLNTGARAAGPDPETREDP